MALDDERDSPDLPRPTLVGRDDLAGIADRVRGVIEAYGAGFAPLDEADVAPLVERLAGGSPFSRTSTTTATS